VTVMQVERQRVEPVVGRGRPALHLWIYNHPFYGISDQVEYFNSTLQQNGYEVSIGREPKPSALNVVIENFSTETRDVLLKFCRSNRKQVAVIMTEHIDFDGRQIFIHGDPLWSDNDYMHPATQIDRLRSLMECLPYIRCFMVLGDLPELRGMSQMIPGVDVRAIPFPRIDFIEAGRAPASDLLFTGVMTKYRAGIMTSLAAAGLVANCPQRFVSRKVRDSLNRSARLVLNIPQRESWQWLSLMRIVAALRCGRATVSLGTSDTSRIAECTFQLDVKAPDWRETLKSYVADWVPLYQTAYDNYSRMREAFEAERPFPHDMIEYWAITDRI
jgi:hypothetical protein